jgi:hypothetical protein
LKIVLPPNAELQSRGLRLDATVQVMRIASELEEKGFAAAGDLAYPESSRGKHKKVPDTEASTQKTQMARS